MDQSLVGRVFPPTRPYLVTEERLREFAAATGGEYAGSAPPTFPIVVAFEAMNGFLSDVGASLERIVHGEQRFGYERPVVAGDVLTATLSVTGLRRIGGNDIVSTVSEIHDEAGDLVCTAGATLVHRGAGEEASA